ncbi:MAG: DNA-processing protein DprA [Burkholderiales bacterium]
MNRDEVGAWIALSLIPDLGPASFRKLLARFGDPQNILAASQNQLKEIVAPDVARKIGQDYREESLANTLAWLEPDDRHLITLADLRYPPALLHIADPPPVLYVQGDPSKLSAPALAIVGSRNATPQGTSTATSLARALSDCGLIIVSGFALGIDSAAHRGGLAGAAGSIAVLGTGIDVVYPARNRELARELVKKGALVSEFPLGYPALAANFPRRNRVISGLSLGCLVVEAALHSGSLITARLALEQGREVLAVPGSIHSPLSKGPHSLIKQGATLVEQVDDVLRELRWRTTSRESVRSLDADEDPQLAMLLSVIGFDLCAIDTMCSRSGLAPNLVSSMLLELELEGKVASLPGGLYQRIG